MSQKTTHLINTKLIESLAQIILSLTEEERQLLAQKTQYLQVNSGEYQQQLAALQQDIALGVKQLESGEYVEYSDSSLPKLLETIKTRGKQRL